MLAPAIGDYLASALTIEIPGPRFDEVPTTFHDIARDRFEPDIALHTSAIEFALLRAMWRDEDELVSEFRAAIRWWEPGDDRTFRGEHLREAIERNFVQFGERRPRDLRRR